MAKIALELDKLTSLNFGLRVLRWVAWTIWSDACLLDQITYVIFTEKISDYWNRKCTAAFYPIGFISKQETSIF